MPGLGILGMIFVGGLAGWIATVLLNQRRYLVANIVIGLVGSIGGAFAALRLKSHFAPGMAPVLLVSAAGSVLLLALFSLFHRRA